MCRIGREFVLSKLLENVGNVLHVAWVDLNAGRARRQWLFFTGFTISIQGLIQHLAALLGKFEGPLGHTICLIARKMVGFERGLSPHVDRGVTDSVC